MKFSNNRRTRFPNNFNSSVLPITPRTFHERFSPEWRSSSEVFAIDLVVLAVQIILIVASVAYFCRAIEVLAATEKAKTRQELLANFADKNASFSGPQDYLNYVKNLEKVDNAKDCWISLAHGSRSYPNCPLSTKVKNALLIGKSESVNTCWELINHQELLYRNPSLAKHCIQ